MNASHVRPWPALWSMIIGFFMLLVDNTIVSVANPAIMKALDADITAVIWVTSAYLLAYAVPLLITGRLGDRFGPKNVYLLGLAIFTLSSLWCGLSGSIEMLIVARVVQGLGAALMTPQTMAVITRVFPPDQRGPAMGVWGATSGVAMLVGPVAGGLLVDSLGWEWIFFVNVPVGVVGFVLAAVNVPKLETHRHRFDFAGVVLSAVGMFLLVFGIQELNSTDISAVTIRSMIVGGIIVLVVFIAWQALNKSEPLVPLRLFRDRNFSLANLAMSFVGFAVTCMALPLVFYFQVARGLTPTQSGLMLLPMAVLTMAIAPFSGRALDRVNPRNFAVFGAALTAVSMFLYSWMLSPDVAIGWLLIPSAVMGIASPFLWAPIANTATRNLEPRLAGAGAGVYNTTRQIGGVLGSASIAALIENRITANFPAQAGQSGGVSEASFVGQKLPEFLRLPFTNAMSEALLLPAFAFLVVVLVVIFFAKPVRREGWGGHAKPAEQKADAAPTGSRGTEAPATAAAAIATEPAAIE